MKKTVMLSPSLRLAKARSGQAPDVEGSSLSRRHRTTWKPLTIGIIGGKGRMGQWFARLFRSLGFTVLVSDTTTRLTNSELIRRSDVILFSVPIPAMESVISSVLPHVRSHQLLIDLCSLKETPVKTMLKSRAHVIGIHPMFGPFSKNMNRKPVILCPARATVEQKEWLTDLLLKEGAVIKTMTPAAHDKAMATVQMLTHLRNFVFAETIKNLNINTDMFLELASPPSRIEFDCMGRILSQNLDMYAAITTHNPYRKQVIAEYQKACKKLSDQAQRGNADIFERTLKVLERRFRKVAPACQRESDLLIEHLTNHILS